MSELRVRETGDFGRYHVQSESDSSKFYLVQLFELGDHCDCPDHLYRKSHCKHIKAAESVYLKKCLRFGEHYCRISEPDEIGKLFKWLVSQKQPNKINKENE